MGALSQFAAQLIAGRAKQLGYKPSIAAKYHGGLADSAYARMVKTPEAIAREEAYEAYRKAVASTSNLPVEEWRPIVDAADRAEREAVMNWHLAPETQEWSKQYRLKEAAQSRIDLAKQVAFDLANKEKWKTAPWHGTDIDALEGILQDGLKFGSALDYTKGKDWAREYPVRVVVPSATKGRKIEHNDYYTSGNVARAAKVYIDLNAIVPEYTQEYINKYNQLKEAFPSVEFRLIGKLE